jgi:DedD protein
MLRNVRDEEIETESARKDVELTLGPALVLACVCGLLLLCGLCFGVGYTYGRRNGSEMAATKVAPSGQTLAEQAAANVPKPAATPAPQPIQPPASNPASEPSTASVPAASNPAANVPAQSTESAVRPAMTASPASQTTSPATTPAQVQPALPAGSGIMVQIAAVSHVEDANVLMAALRKHGYTVTARREVDDNLIHVQVGPFADRSEANAMSLRLLSDGYNAIVLP